MDSFKLMSFMSRHAGIITLAMAIVGFAVAYLQALYFSSGQASIANYLIFEVGVTAIWTGAVVVVAGAALQTFFMLLLFNTKGNVTARYGWPISIVV